MRGGEEAFAAIMTATGALTSLAPQARVGFALVPTEGPDSDAEMDAWTLMFEGAVDVAGGERVGEATWVGSVVAGAVTGVATSDGGLVPAGSGPCGVAVAGGGVRVRVGVDVGG